MDSSGATRSGWRRGLVVFQRWRQGGHRLKRALLGPRQSPHPATHTNAGWEYKVVQMVAQVAADPADASRRLGGALSAESLRSQFPQHYGGINGRQQINDFLNRLGDDNWELVQIQQIGELPLMIFKRRKQLPEPGNGAKQGSSTQEDHGEKT